MTYIEFYHSYLSIKDTTPSYRLGQHFINLFIKEAPDEIFKGLWEMSEVKAVEKIYEILAYYQWDVDNLPLMEKGDNDVRKEI